MKDNIKAVRLISGEVVVGELEFRDEDKGKVAFKNLLQIILMGRGKSVGFEFAPLHPFYNINEVIEFKDIHILMWIKELPEVVIQAYNKILNPSNIVVPTKSIIK